MQIELWVASVRLLAWSPLFLGKILQEVHEAKYDVLVQGIFVGQLIEVGLLAIKQRLEEVTDLDLNSLLRRIYQMLHELNQEWQLALELFRAKGELVDVWHGQVSTLVK